MNHGQKHSILWSETAQKLDEDENLQLKLLFHEFNHWYQMNPKIFLYKTPLSVQIYYLVGLSLLIKILSI